MHCSTESKCCATKQCIDQVASYCSLQARIYFLFYVEATKVEEHSMLELFVRAQW